MSAKSECNSLADTFETVRALSKSFISKIDEKDIHESIVINGKEMNSPYWIVAHLAWAEAFLILATLGAEESPEEEEKYDWLNEYGFGTKPAEVKTKPPLSEVIEAMDYIHERAMKHLRSLDDAFLDEKNKFNMTFGGKKDNRIAVHHAIRHEPMHIGQLTWFMKSKGMETF